MSPFQHWTFRNVPSQVSSATRAKTRVEFLAVLTLCTDSYLLTSPHLEDLFKVFPDRRSGLPPLVASRALGRVGIDVDDRLGFLGGGGGSSLTRSVSAGAVARATILRPNAAPK